MSWNEKADIQFLKWQPLYESEKPFQLFLDIPPEAPDERRTNLVFETRTVPIRNIRGEESRFSLDNNGFVYRKFEGFKNLDSKDEVLNEYLPAVQRLLEKEVEGAHKVLIFDWRMRESDAKDQGGFIDTKNNMTLLQPANFAHSDQGPSSVLKRIKTQLPDEAESLLNDRIRVLNIWKPLRNHVKDWPLALCDGSSLRASDLVETDTVRASYVGTNLYSQYSPDTQNWFYLRDQSPDEVVIFKQFDSDPSVQSSLSLHSAFRQEDIEEGCAPRKSIEVRAILFTKAKGDSNINV